MQKLPVHRQVRVLSPCPVSWIPVGLPLSGYSDCSPEAVSPSFVLGTWDVGLRASSVARGLILVLLPPLGRPRYAEAGGVSLSTESIWLVLDRVPVTQR